MRNLKRALSLALASIMVLGLMVVGAGAASYNDFTDKDEIVHKDAVSMVTELGIIAGLTDGSFGPTKNIDRASFARLICVALNGGKEPMLGNITTTFSDTKGNWAEKYIAYCVDRGIIAGKGNNTFAPSANVTGSEAAKMLLVALGYNAANEGIGGATWQITTDVLANQAGLYDDLSSMNTSTALTRDQAAQMIYNVLNAETVTYSYSYTPNGTTTVLTKTGKTMLEDKFGVVTVEGIVVGNEVSNLAGDQTSKNDGETAIKVTNYKDGQSNFGNADNDKVEIFKVSSDASVLGRSVTLYVKPSSTASSSANKATVVGSVLVNSDNNVVTDSSTKTLAELAKDNDLSLVTSEDSGTAKTMLAPNYGKAAAITNDQKAANNTRGVLVTMIDNDGNDSVDYVLTETFNFGKVTKYSTKDDGSITIANKGTVASEDDKDDVVGFADVAKDDYVLFAQIGGKLYVEKAKSVEGKITAYKLPTKNSSGVITTSGTVTVDGTKYTASGLSGYKDGTKLTDPNEVDSFSTGVFYLDTQGYIVAIGDTTASAKDYALVMGYDPASNNVDEARAKVAMSDGTVKTYTVNEWLQADGKDDEGSPAAKMLCTYSLTDDNEINLRTVTLGDDNISGKTAFEFSKGKSTIAVGDTKYYADDSTVFYYVTTKSGNYDKADVYIGVDNAPSVKVNSSTTVKTVSNAIVFDSTTKTAKVVVVIDGKAATNDSFLYLVKYTGHTSDGNTFRAIVDGEFLSEDITVKTGSSEASVGLYQYSKTSKGFYELEDMTDNSVVKGVISRDPSAKSVVLDTAGIVLDGEYILTSSSIIAYIDGDDTYTEASLAKGDEVTIVYNDDKEIEGIYITANEEANAANVVVASVDCTTEKVTDTTYKINVDLTANAGLVKADFVFSSGSTQVWTIAAGSSDDSVIAANDTVKVTASDGKTVITYTFVDSHA